LEIFGGRAPNPRDPNTNPRVLRKYRGSEPTQISGEYPAHHPITTTPEATPFRLDPDEHFFKIFT